VEAEKWDEVGGSGEGEEGRGGEREGEDCSRSSYHFDCVLGLLEGLRGGGVVVVVVHGGHLVRAKKEEDRFC